MIKNYNWVFGLCNEYNIALPNGKERTTELAIKLLEEKSGYSFNEIEELFNKYNDIKNVHSCMLLRKSPKQPLMPKEDTENIKSSVDDLGQGKSIWNFKATPKELKDNLLKAKMTNKEYDRWRVDDTYTEQDYEHCKRFTTSGGSTVAVKDNGDIISVCKNQNDTRLSGSQLLQYAISKGGNKLDAFGEKLYKFYTKYGFEPVSWTPFNKECAPHDWKEEYGEEPVIFYKYTGNKTSLTYDEFINKTKATSDYDTAYKLRDMEIEK